MYCTLLCVCTRSQHKSKISLTLYYLLYCVLYCSVLSATVPGHLLYGIYMYMSIYNANVYASLCLCP